MLEVIIHPIEQEIAPGSTYRRGVFLFGRTLYTNMKNIVSRQKMISMRILMTKAAKSCNTGRSCIILASARIILY